MRGFVLKESPLADLLRAITQVLRACSYVDPALAVSLTPRTSAVDLLTWRQVQVLRLLGEGLHDGEIAERLFISTETVRAHVKRAMGRLGVSTRAQAMAEAFRRSYSS